MKRKIVRRRCLPAPPDFPPHLHPVLTRIYAARGITSAEDLEHSTAALLPFSHLRGMEEAVSLLERALREQWRVLVVGDFDADGATSTAVAVRALSSFGLEDVDFLVPNRFEYGYGLTPEIVSVAARRDPALIMTVDNGISSLSGVEEARACGIRVLVTDHHLPGESLPDADAIVNPNQPGCNFPSKALAGVGVVFYLMLGLRARLRETDWFAAHDINQPNLAELLDLVALGTVADVVPLDANNRILVAQGLARIRHGKARPGIVALIEAAGRHVDRTVAGDLGFAVGPRLNAAGRLDDMSVGIRCLLAPDMAQARELAAELDRLNRERRSIESDMHEQALIDLEEDGFVDGDEAPAALCLYRPDWHEGVIGILASRIKERLHRPVIVLTDAENGQVKGSARSIPGLHIRDVLDSVAVRHPGLLLKFGGHAMAAGLTLERHNYEKFRDALEREAERSLEPDQLQGVILSDGELQGELADLELARQLRYAGPWGQGFPEPVFDSVFEVIQQRVVGERHLKLLLRWKDSGKVVDAIAFNQLPGPWLSDATHVRAAYKLDLNEYQGKTSVQLVVEQLEPALAGEL